MSAWSEQPLALRRATSLCLVLGALTSLVATVTFDLTSRVDEVSPTELTREGWGGALALKDEALQKAQQAVIVAELSALESMQLPRMTVLLLLWLVSVTVLVAAVWLRWPGESDRAAVGRFLGLSCLGAGLLRTIDGAMDLVVTRKAAVVQESFLAVSGYPAAGFTWLVTALSVGFTFTVVALFVFLGLWFRSERAQAMLDE